MLTFPILFAVLSDPSDEQMALNLAQNFPDYHIEIRPGQWFVIASGTAKELTEKLGVTPEGPTGPAVVIAVGGYYGVANLDIWEWVAAKAGRPIRAA